MATIATLTTLPIVIEASPTEADVKIDHTREYTFAHDSENTSGTANADTIYFKYDASGVSNDETAGVNKVKLLAGRAVVVGPGVAQVFYQTKAAAGSPTMTVIPSGNREIING